MAIHLTYSNATEALVQALTERLRERRVRGVSPLTPAHLVVPNRNLERYLELSIAQALGIAANLRFHRLERFVARWLAQEGVGPVLDRRALERHILGALLDDDWLAAEPGGALAGYVDAEDRETSEVRRVQLALRLARLFEAYGYSRPELLDRWSEGPVPSEPTEAWQARLARRAMERGELPLHAALRKLGSARPDALPQELHVFGLSYVARVFQWAFAALGERTDLYLYVLNPCMEFWEDVPTEHEARRRLPRRSERVPSVDGELHPLVASDADDPPALTWWGRPGREHVHLLNELTGADFEPRFVDPTADERSVLRVLQRDILLREPAPRRPSLRADDSVCALACPGIRREVEIVAEEIWRRIDAEGSTLRFNDIAVFVHSDVRDLYLPHVASVFAEAGDLPHHVVDLPLAAESTLVDAAARLLDLLVSRFRRPDVLALLLHPSLRLPTRAVVDRGRWARLVDRLGAFHGLDRGEHAETYIDRDLVNWDQAVRRLALGTFLTGEASGDPRTIEMDGERYLPEETSADEGGVVLAALLRSLLGDARYARQARLSLTGWSRFVAGLFRGYLDARTAREEAELRRCLAAAESLADRDADGAEVGFGVAAELVAEALAGLGGARGEYLAEGVVVSALTPMRAIPFRVVFMLGMGEGVFPTTERRDPLDLRTRRRRVGDVTPVERDKYVFLETLLCARDAVVCSWVARDSLTGDPIEPSPVVRQLLDLLGRSYVVDAEALVREFPLRRHDEGRGRRAIVEAGWERQAAELGAKLRTELGRDLDERDLRTLAGTDRPHARAVTRMLALPHIPAGRTLPTEVEVSLDALRRFLEAPLQGWAAAVLGLADELEGDAGAREDEPFAPAPLELAQTLREAFVEGLRQCCPPVARYAEQVERLQAHGRWPVGTLASQRRRFDEEVLRSWQRVFRVAVAPDGARPRRVRFGSGSRADPTDELREAIRVGVNVQGRSIGVRITGRTQVLVEDGQASLILVPRRGPVGAQLQRERLVYGLRAFLDYVALVASGDERSAHRALILYGGAAAQDASLHFAELTPQTAMSYLRQIAGELFGRAHDYFLPCEAVMRDAKGWRELTGRKLLAQATAVRLQEKGGRSRYGPVSGGERYALPDPDEALAMVRRRFGLYFQLVGLSR